MPKKAQKTLDELMELNGHTKNYKLYRQHLRTCKPPLIPQIGIISRDLFGLEENNDDFLDKEKSIINLDKARLLEKITNEIVTMQGSPYPFPEASEEVASMTSFFQTLPSALATLTEKDLYERSLALEKRAEHSVDKK